MQIHVPQDMGGELKVLPETSYSATLSDMFYGLSKANNPKITAKFIITSEPESDDRDMESAEYFPTVGETILDVYSLMSNAIWRLNDLYKKVNGENLPQGDYDVEQFVEMIKEKLLGTECFITVVTDDSQGSPRSKIDKCEVTPF